MQENRDLIESFYSAFNKRDYAKMQSLYHPAATFTDPVFGELDSKEVKAMWQMLIMAAKDLKVQASNIKADPLGGECDWDAFYTYSTTGRHVHNKIHARFEIANGRIIRHVDDFDLYRWTRMAFGLTGALAGWTPFFKKQIRETAQKRLAGFIRRNAMS